MDSEQEKRTRDRLFEGNKHVSTLSASALGLVLAAAQFGGIEANVTAVVVVFGTALVVSLTGMTDAVASEIVSRRRESRYANEFMQRTGVKKEIARDEWEALVQAALQEARKAWRKSQE